LAQSNLVIFEHVRTYLFTLMWIVYRIGIKNLKTLTHVKFVRVFFAFASAECTVHHEVALHKLCSHVCGQYPYKCSHV